MNVSARANDNGAQGESVDMPEFTMTGQVQDSLDRILDFINKSSYMPRFELKGALIPLCLDLNDQVLGLLPDEMHGDAKLVIQQITNNLCDFADASGLSGFELTMEFKK